VQLQLFGQVDDDIFRHVSLLTQDILVFRKIVLASRELMHELASRKSAFVSETTQPFLENMAGALERLGGDLTTEREVLNETLNLYMGMVSHRTNKVVNRLTVHQHHLSAPQLPVRRVRHEPEGRARDGMGLRLRLLLGPLPVHRRCAHVLHAPEEMAVRLTPGPCAMKARVWDLCEPDEAGQCAGESPAHRCSWC
jgi:hypothetical protein